MTRSRRCLLCLMLVPAVSAAAWLGAGCASPPPSPAPAVPPAPENTHVRLTLAPAVPRALDPTALAVHVTDAHGRPVAGARVTADLSMPGMAMPPNTVVLQPAGPGTYTGQGRFSMPDKWAVSVTVLNKGRRTTAVFPVSVR